MNTVTVNASRKYDVLIGAGLLDRCGELIAAVHVPCAAAIITDDTVNALYGDRVEKSLAAAGYRVVRFVFPHGEENKNLMTFAAAQNFLAENRLSRTDLVVALGGGVVGDLAGFVAATYLRGIRFVQIPTTLLAAVDSSVGGKTAVDLPAGKNLCGCFSQPSLVICDYETLSTLPKETFADGCAEVVKYGVLADADLFSALEEKGVYGEEEAVITHCVSIKRDVVCADEFDNGERQKLNLGHTVGHAIEQNSNFAVSHGSAVAMGMAIIARAAAKRGLCAGCVPQRVEALLEKLHLPTRTEYDAEELLSAAMRDKKIRGAAIDLVVPRDIGKCELMKIGVEELSAWIREGL
ncbi:MAG: 3-dehydroquinate synthase [Oscillospiraceae bacterium]|nr:3-dehydroquinate synthase [Oscillospiraceae bacterium]